MKIKTKKLSYKKAIAQKRPKHKAPIRPNILFRLLIRILGFFDLMRVNFKFETEGLQKIDKKQPCLILMNHSCFLDLKIVNRIFWRTRPYCIVCTSDGFVGKRLLMRLIGCIPTTKFVSDTQLIRDMQYTVNELKTSVLMYPEASYSFDGRATTLPRKLGTLLKRLNVPVISIITEGAFSHDPLYNGLQLRKVPVSAKVKCLLTQEEIKEKSVAELDAILDKEFEFDSFLWQKQNNIEITEPFRADGLERILYKCACCEKEGQMVGKGEEIVCNACGKRYYLTTLGELEAINGETEFSHIPDWFSWQKKEVLKELENASYLIDTEVEIGVMVNYKAIYMVGSGRLVHNNEGFTLTGCNGELSYTQKPLSSYGLYADYLWYEIGDAICIGTKDCLYYCFPKGKVSVAKARIAAEEMYKKIKSARKVEA